MSKMAAENTFEDVLSYVAKSKLNFSIYRTPFSAQLSLKKTFAKHFNEDKADTIKAVEPEVKAKVEELEKRLAISDNEIYRLKEIIKETEEARDHLENRNHYEARKEEK